MSFNPVDVHRLLDNKLPPDKKCEAVAVVEQWSATINGEQVSGLFERDGWTADQVAAWMVSQVTPASDANAQSEGAEIEEPDPEDEHGGEATSRKRGSKHKK